MIEWTEEKLIAAGYKIQNAKITSANLTMQGHGCLALDIGLEGNGFGVVYGGRCIGHGYLGAKDFSGTPTGIEYIMRIMDTVGVESINDLKGKYVRVPTKGWGESVEIIGNILDDKWFDQKSFFSEAHTMEKILNRYDADELKDLIIVANRMLGGMDERDI